MIKRVVARAAAEIEQSCGEWFEWDKHWRGLSPEAFEVLTPEEQVTVWFSKYVQSPLGDHLQKTGLTQLLEKVRLCLWYHGTEDGWNPLVEAYTKICTFEFDEPGFTVEIDYPWALQGYGSGVKCANWLDGGLAYLLFYKGEHVACLGFSVSKQGLLIQQAQATRKQGNRWMYRLTGRLLDVMVDKLERHFNCPTWIIDGASQGKYLRQVHPKKIPFPEEELARIEATYNAPVQGFVRTGETYEVDYRVYHRIMRIPEPKAGDPSYDGAP